MTSRPNRTAQVEITETSPLSNHFVKNQAEKSTMDAETKRILIKIVIDVVLLSFVGLPVLTFFIFGVPYKRGFNCDDESLMYPFKESTVTHEILYTIGFGVPIVTILVTEFFRWKLNMETDRDLKLFGRPIPIWVQHSYKYIGLLFFGAACSQLTTDIAKYTIGRLRPHFFDVCKPLISDNTTCSDPINLHRYITDFTCNNPTASAKRLKEVRLSFMSGHSSFSMFTMLFAALYLQARFDWKGSKLLKHFLQFYFVSMAWYTALSRISNYKHHWSDVLAGTTQGIIVATIIVFCISDLFKNKWQTSSKPPVSRYELDSNDSANN